MKFTQDKNNQGNYQQGNLLKGPFGRKGKQH